MLCATMLVFGHTVIGSVVRPHALLFVGETSEVSSTIQPYFRNRTGHDIPTERDRSGHCTRRTDV